MPAETPRASPAVHEDGLGRAWSVGSRQGKRDDALAARVVVGAVESVVPGQPDTESPADVVLSLSGPEQHRLRIVRVGVPQAMVRLEPGAQPHGNRVTAAVGLRIELKQ